MSPIVWIVSARLRSLFLETLVGRPMAMVERQARINTGREKRNIPEEGTQALQMYDGETKVGKGAQKGEKAEV